MKKEEKIRPRLSHFGFWDVDLEKLDFDKYADFVIVRVMERGTEEDTKAITDYYGEDKIIATITSATSLLRPAISAGKYYFGLKDTDFKCFTKTRQGRNFSMF